MWAFSANCVAKKAHLYNNNESSEAVWQKFTTGKMSRPYSNFVTLPHSHTVTLISGKFVTLSHSKNMSHSLVRSTPFCARVWQFDPTGILSHCDTVTLKTFKPKNVPKMSHSKVTTPFFDLTHYSEFVTLSHVWQYCCKVGIVTLRENPNPNPDPNPNPNSNPNNWPLTKWVNVIVAPESNPSSAFGLVGLTFSRPCKVLLGLWPRRTLHGGFSPGVAFPTLQQYCHTCDSVTNSL